MKRHRLVLLTLLVAVATTACDATRATGYTAQNGVLMGSGI